MTTLLLMAGMLILVLLLRPILRAARGLFFGGRVAPAPAAEPQTSRLEGREPGAALPPAQSTPVNGFVPARADTAELSTPPSVTEETTRKLNS